MKRTILILCMLVLTANLLSAQSFTSLWNQVEKAKETDKPRSALAVLQKIETKALAEKSYGNLIASLFSQVGCQEELSDDSLTAVIARFDQQDSIISLRDEVAAWVYRVARCKYEKRLRKVSDNPIIQALAGNNEAISPLNYLLSHCSREAKDVMLAKDAALKYLPLVEKGRDSQYFNHDLVSVFASELNDYAPLEALYAASNQRQAACLAGAMNLREGRKLYLSQQDIDKQLVYADSLIAVYSGLNECGEIAVRKYFLLANGRSDVKKRIDWIDESLRRWPLWTGMEQLRNERKDLTNAEFYLEVKREDKYSSKPLILYFKRIRNVKRIDVKVIPLQKCARKLIETYDQTKETYAKIQPYLRRDKAISKTLICENHAEYEFFDDSLALQALPVGAYIIENTFEGMQKDVYPTLLCISDLRVVKFQNPDNTSRFAVLNADSGHPVAGAKLHFKSTKTSKVMHLTTDSNGECTYRGTENNMEIYATHGADSLQMKTYVYNYGNRQRLRENTRKRVNIFTDRSIYRPGQKVMLSVLAYDVANNVETSIASNREITVTVQDVNGNNVSTTNITTDEYGTAATEFQLPEKCLNGNFSIIASKGSVGYASIRVEEYVRPTFEAEFLKPEAAYKTGDTITVEGIARTYSGVPVADARVVYKVRNQASLWFLHPGIEQKQILCDSTITDAEGKFKVKVPLLMPRDAEMLRCYFCNVRVDADVTDIAGESHAASLSLPIGLRETILTTDMPQKLRGDSPVKVTLNRRNMAGKEIQGCITLMIDGNVWKNVEANKAFVLPDNLVSGKHNLRAICEKDTLEHAFTLFRITDEQPVENTPLWAYSTSEQFDEDPSSTINLQFGTALRSVHALYSVVANGKIIEQGTMQLDSSLVNRTYKYSDDYAEGVNFCVVWAKNGKMYSHTFIMKRPLRDKSLHIKWSTFRNKLEPGQKEEWRLCVTDKAGNAVNANVMATLYDKSLDAILKHNWAFSDPRYVSLTTYNWRANMPEPTYSYFMAGYEHRPYINMTFSHFDYKYFDAPARDEIMIGYGGPKLMKQTLAAAPRMAKNAVAEESEIMADAAVETMSAKAIGAYAVGYMDVSGNDEIENVSNSGANDHESVAVRENLSETAFFFPQLRTDSKGVATLSFTLPESVTTWRFIGFANDNDMRFGTITDEVVAQKTVMIQPRMPRFLRSGDVAYIPASVSLLEQEGEAKQTKNVKARVKMQLLDAETENTIYEKENSVTLNAGETAATSFAFDTKNVDGKMLICRMTVVCNGYSDGEQHYLPVLSSKQEIVNSLALTIRNARETTIDLSELLPASAENAHVAVDYTARPELLLVESLPYLTENIADNAVSLSTAYYANTLASFIAKQNPGVAKAIQEWNKPGNNLESALSKNEDLKFTLLNETPWLADAKGEEERMSRLYRLLDAQLLSYRNTYITQRLSRLQNADGSWSWWKGMNGSRFISMHVMQTLLRLNANIGTHNASNTGIQNTSSALITRGWNYLDNEIAEDIAEMKKNKEKSYVPVLYSFHVDYLYNIAISHRNLSGKAKTNVDYLMRYLVSSTVKDDMTTKAKAAIILASNGKKHDADEYIESIRQHTVYREDMGRYFDSYRAAYSWFDYRIPTQTSVIEALKIVAPHDRQTITEMQRWILQSKRTQAWDTPVNAVNAIYAMIPNAPSAEVHDTANEVQIKLDGKAMTSMQNGLSTHYDADIKNVKSQHSVSINANPTAEVVDGANAESWAGVYVKFVQPSTEVSDAANGITVKRELSSSTLKIGDKVTVTITITADRDYDFVTITDSRAACLEPVQQLSGWRNGYYQVMRDSQTQYHFDALCKGTHVIKTEYYVAKQGTYASGTVTAQCAYSPEFNGRAAAMKIAVGEK